MKRKRLRTLLRLMNSDGEMYAVFTASGEGRSNDDAERSCWSKVRKQIRDRFPGARWRVRAIHYRAEEGA